MPQLRRYSPTKLYDDAQMVTFGDFFCVLHFSELHSARFRPASFVSDIAIFVLKRDVKLQLTN